MFYITRIDLVQIGYAQKPRSRIQGAAGSLNTSQNLFVNLDLHDIIFVAPITQLHTVLNQIKPNGISHLYHLEQTISAFRVVRWNFSFLFKF